MDFDEIISGLVPDESAPMDTYNEATARLDLLVSIAACVGGTSLSEQVPDKHEGPVMLGGTLMLVGVLTEIAGAYIETLQAVFPDHGQATKNLCESAVDEGRAEGARLIAAIRAMPGSLFEDAAGPLAILSLFGEEPDEDED